jgi:membrane protease YdiL (CAAX protease family)
VVKISISPPSPLSPKRWPAESFRWYWSLGFGVLVLAAQLVPAAIVQAGMLVSGAARLQDLRTLSWPTLIATFVSYAVALAVVFGLLPLLAQRSVRDLGLRAPRLGDLAWGLGGAVAMVIAAAVVGSLQEWLFHLKADEVQVHMLRAARGSLAAGFVFTALIAAPLFEELVFRGFAFNALLRYLPLWPAVLLSGALFALAHWLPGNLGALGPLAGVGMVLAAIYYRSGSLVAAMLAHACFNTLTVVTVLVFHQQF